MKKTNRVKPPNQIHPQVQASLNRLLIDNIQRLAITAAQRAAIVTALLAPALTEQALRRKSGKGRRKRTIAA
jgi:hypothetical protein